MKTKDLLLDTAQASLAPAPIAAVMDTMLRHYAAIPVVVAGLLLGGSPVFAAARSSAQAERVGTATVPGLSMTGLQESGHAQAFSANKHSLPHKQAKRAKAKKPRSSPNARKLFAAKKLPAALSLSSIGTYTNGCIAGASALPIDGPYHQVMRLSRNRNWGHPRTIAYLKWLSEQAARDGWPGLLIGDMAQPRGGPMLTGHASHMIGLDVDIWLMPRDHVLSDADRETLDAKSVLQLDSAELDANDWTQAHENFVRDAAQGENVTRVFVTPAIKKRLCQKKDPNGKDAWWLSRIRPCHSGVCTGHDDHIHVRLACQPGDKACRNQPPPELEDGCGSEIDEAMKEVAADPPHKSGQAQLVGPHTPTPRRSQPVRLKRRSSIPLAKWEGDIEATVVKERDIPRAENPPFPLSKMPNACVKVLNARDKTSSR